MIVSLLSDTCSKSREYSDIDIPKVVKKTKNPPMATRIERGEDSGGPAGGGVGTASSGSSCWICSSSEGLSILGASVSMLEGPWELEFGRCRIESGQIISGEVTNRRVEFEGNATKVF